MANPLALRSVSSLRQIVHFSLSWLVMGLAVISGIIGVTVAFFGAAYLLNKSGAEIIQQKRSVFWMNYSNEENEYEQYF